MKKLSIFLLCLAVALLATACAGSNSETGECMHKYGTWSVTRQATCSTDGMQSRTCETCGYMESNTIAALGHAEVQEKDNVAATCTTDGTTAQFRCSVCNTITKEATKIPATGHTVFVSTAGKAATCTEAGWSEASHCSTCNTVLSEKAEIPALGHISAPIAAVPATCTTPGKTEGSGCANCDLIFTAQEETPALGHDYVLDAAVPATCTEDGKTEGAHCVTCGDVMEKQTTIPKLSSHAYSRGYCTFCGKKDENYVQAYGIGETWVIPGQVEFSITAANEHGQCSSYLIENRGFGKEQVILVTIKYKNLAGGNFKPQIANFIVADAQGEQGRLYSSVDGSLIGCYHGKEPSESSDGLAATCVLPYALNNKSSFATVLIKIELNGQKYTGRFEVPITPMPEEPEEDKLEGCTFTVDNTLPKTIHYYDYNDKIKSSCQVTSISFEVSGDDLYIYFSGKKTYDANGAGQSASCKIGWKLYDSNNNVIEDGTASTLSLAEGEGFLKTKDTAYDCIKPGGSYRLVIMNVN